MLSPSLPPDNSITTSTGNPGFGSAAAAARCQNAGAEAPDGKEPEFRAASQESSSGRHAYAPLECQCVHQHLRKLCFLERKNIANNGIDRPPPRLIDRSWCSDDECLKRSGQIIRALEPVLRRQP